MHDITILNHVILTLNTHLSCLADSCLRSVLDIVLVFNYLSTNKAFLEVGMDDTTTLRSLPAFFICPSLDFHLTRSEKGLKIQQGIGLLDEAINTTLFEAKLLEEHLLIFV